MTSPYVFPGLPVVRKERPAHTNVLIETVTFVVCEEYGVTEEDIKGRSRKPKYRTARHMAMYVARKMGISFKTIGKYYERHHATVMYAVDSIESHMPMYDEIKTHYKNIMEHF